MPDVPSFSDLEPEFKRTVASVVWPTVTTMDRRGRPRARAMQPIWERSTGYMLTGRRSLKAKHLAANPYVSVSYVDTSDRSPVGRCAYVECTASWVDDVEEKKRIWEFAKNTSVPGGFDPAPYYPTGPEDPENGVLKLTPWRVEVSSVMGLAEGTNKVWRGASA